MPLSPDPVALRHRDKVCSADKVVRELLLTALQLPRSVPILGKYEFTGLLAS